MRTRSVGPARDILRWCGLAGVLVAAGCMSAAHTRAPASARAGAASEPLALSEPASTEPACPEPPCRDAALPVPFDLQEAVERATILGTNLFVLEVATARARDALAERSGAPEQNGIAHYLALMGDDDDGRPDGSVEVLFFSDEEVPRLAYRVVVGGGRRSPEVRVQDPPGVVHEPLMTLLSARMLALEAVPRTNQAVNTVLMPQRNGQIVVYVLAASSKANVAVLGRHYRVEVAEDGAEVDRVTALSKAELELPTRDRAGQRLATLAITDGEVDHPTETHVFASRLANVPLIVTTGRGRWKVRATGIDYLGPR
jgi:hypothetical protein